MSITYEQKDRIATLTINRPEAMNALDPVTSRALIEAWIAFRDDAEVWVAILTGAGEQAFCAGADLKAIGDYYRGLTPTERRARAETEPGLGGITRHLNIWKPIITAINGHCLAGGLELALCSDIRLAAEHATFGLTEVRWGIVPGAGGTQRLPRSVPLCKALEMILTAEKIDASEAYRLGLINQVVPLPELLPTAMKVAERICENGPLAVRAAKEAVWRGLELPLEDGLRLEWFLAELLRQTEDAQEGPRAFAEKRPPRFQAK